MLLQGYCCCHSHMSMSNALLCRCGTCDELIFSGTYTRALDRWHILHGSTTRPAIWKLYLEIPGPQGPNSYECFYYLKVSNSRQRIIQYVQCVQCVQSVLPLAGTGTPDTSAVGTVMLSLVDRGTQLQSYFT